jgi:hypothetical protein
MVALHRVLPPLFTVVHFFSLLLLDRVGAPVMGQVVVAMPRTNYKGAFGNEGSNEPSCSQIIGSTNSDDQMLATQMASRLSTRSGLAVFISCQLSSTSSGSGDVDASTWGNEMDGDFVAHRAAALAEKEVWRLLQQQEQEQQEKSI